MSLCFVRVFHSSGVVLQQAAEKEWGNGLYLVCTTREERPYATNSLRVVVCTIILSMNFIFICKNLSLFLSKIFALTIITNLRFAFHQTVAKHVSSSCLFLTHKTNIDILMSRFEILFVKSLIRFDSSFSYFFYIPSFSLLPLMKRKSNYDCKRCRLR
jgi:hypothetical protein